MGDVSDLLKSVNNHANSVLDTSFEVEVTETDYVPNFDDPYLTYDNIDAGVKKCKLLESTVLYVDIRNSAQVSSSSAPENLAKVYSTFIQGMIGAARYYGGHVRNIIGDRVMVVFDSQKCFQNAYNTAVLMNTVANYLLKKKISHFNFECGIGIDYGKMLVTKAGVVRRGEETEFYRSLVWLGQPANVASKLTDVANKPRVVVSEAFVGTGLYYPNIKEWLWQTGSYSSFVGELESQYNGLLKHKNPHFRAFYTVPATRSQSDRPAVLMSDRVYAGLLQEAPDHQSVVNGWIRSTDDSLPNVQTVYGSNVYLTAVENFL